MVVTVEVVAGVVLLVVGLELVVVELDVVDRDAAAARVVLEGCGLEVVLGCVANPPGVATVVVVDVLAFGVDVTVVSAIAATATTMTASAARANMR